MTLPIECEHFISARTFFLNNYDVTNRKCSTGTIPTKGFTKLRQTSNLNETQVLSNTYLLRCKTELNILCTFLDKHNILIMVKLASYLCALLITELASVSLTEVRGVPSHYLV